jgi:hypothetical protein
MSHAVAASELYALLDEQGATGIDRAPGHVRPGVQRARETSSSVAGWATTAPRSAPAAPPAQAGLGAAVAGTMWAWVEPAAAPLSIAPDAGDPTATPGYAAPPLFPRYLSRPATPPGVAPNASAERTELRMPRDVLRAMAVAAAVTGRTQTEVWAAAAREWLSRHMGEDEPPPDPAGPARAAAVPHTAREQCWRAIDILLGDLRAHTALDQPYMEPAA